MILISERDPDESETNGNSIDQHTTEQEFRFIANLGMFAEIPEYSEMSGQQKRLTLLRKYLIAFQKRDVTEKMDKAAVLIKIQTLIDETEKQRVT